MAKKKANNIKKELKMAENIKNNVANKRSKFDRANAVSKRMKSARSAREGLVEGSLGGVGLPTA